MHDIPHLSLHHDWDEPVDAGLVARTLDTEPGVTHVAVVHHETTTGRLNDLPAVGAVCAERGNVTMSFHDGTAAEVVSKGVRGLKAPCAPLDELLAGVPSIRRTGRVDFLSLDVQGAEPIAASTLGTELSYGVVMAEAEAGPRRIGTVLPLLARGFEYAGQIAARPSPANYVTSDVFFNRSHFRQFWRTSRVVAVPN